MIPKRLNRLDWSSSWWNESNVEPLKSLIKISHPFDSIDLSLGNSWISDLCSQLQNWSNCIMDDINLFEGTTIPLRLKIRKSNSTKFLFFENLQRIRMPKRVASANSFVRFIWSNVLKRLFEGKFTLKLLNEWVSWDNVVDASS